MKRIRILTLLMGLLISLTTLPPTATASSSPSNLETTISTDQSSYSPGDVAEITLQLHNTANTAVKDVSWEIDLPASMQLCNGFSSTGTEGQIEAGETFTVTVQANVTKSAPSTNGGESESSTPTKTPLPTTGDNALLTGTIIGCLGIVAVVAGFIARKSHGSLFSMLLVLLALGAIAGYPVQQAYADESIGANRQTTSATCNVFIAGKEETIATHITYTSNENDEGDGNKVQYEFRDDVTVFDMHEKTNNGYLVSIEDATDLHIGDRVAFGPTDESPEGSAGFVTSIEGREGKALLVIEQATTPDEIFKSIYIDASSAVDWSNVELIDGIELDTNSDDAKSRGRANLPEIKFKLNGFELGKGAELNGSVKMNSYVDANVDWNIVDGLKYAKLEVGADIDLSLSAEAESKTEKNITINKRPIPIPLAGGASIYCNINLNISASGEASLGVKFSQVGGVKKRTGGNFEAYSDGAADISAQISATFKAGVAPSATLTMWSIEVIDIQLASGPAATGSLTIRDTGMLCNDVAAYQYFDISCGNNTTWMDAIGLTFNWELWDETTSPLSWKLHIEDGKIVEKCTYGSTATSDFIYEESTSASGIVITHYTGKSTNVVIPNQIDGKDVVGVAFSPLGDLTLIKQISFEHGSKALFFDYGYAGSDPENNNRALEQADFSNATKMQSISISDGGNLRSLDVSNLTNLESLHYHAYTSQGGTTENPEPQGKLNRFVLSKNQSLKELSVSAYTSNEIGSIDISQAPNLEILELGWCGLTSLDLSQNVNLTYLRVYGNSLSSLDLSKNVKLIEINCIRNNLGELKLPTSDTLESFSCQMNSLRTLDLSTVNNLGVLYCYDNNLASLDISSLQKLELLNCNNNELTHLDATLIRSKLAGGYSFFLQCANNRIDNIDELVALSEEFNLGDSNDSSSSWWLTPQK